MPEINGVMMQFFHWYNPDDGTLWKELEKKAGDLAKAGVTALWLPPAYKGVGGKSDVGYGVYDMYDLGEFDQKGSVRTKYGTRDQYLSAIKALKKAKIQIYLDGVLNHRIGADNAEICNATPYPRNDRQNPKGGMQEIKSYSHFGFPGREGKYSGFEWHWWYFDAVDYNDYNQNDRDTIYLFEGKRFDDEVSAEFGNFAYLMGCDIDFQSVEVQEEIINWGKWYLETTGADGFRLDALKHISAWFFPMWHDELEKLVGRELFMVGEYWSNNLAALMWYIEDMGGRMTVFDVPLHYNFNQAGRAGKQYDMRHILDGTVVQARPTHAVTFVENHDSQPLQALESVVEPWFKPLAYALILLRRDGYPCIFYADYYGAEYDDKGHDGNSYHIVMPSHRELIDIFLQARRSNAYGPQHDYFDHPNTIGWTRFGNAEHPKGMAVLMSNGEDGYKWMETRKPNASYIDMTGAISGSVRTNNDGWGEFYCKGGSVSVWVEV